MAQYDTAAIIIAYGSNLSSGRGSAQQALDLVATELKGRGVIINKISRLWRSKAWPNPEDPPYSNAVMQAETFLQPTELLYLLHDLEREAGRVRDEKRNAPRVLDLDLIAFGNQILEGLDGLILPHPRASERAFVMGPLAEICPYWRHPSTGKTAAELYRSATVGTDAYPVGAA